MIMTERFEQAIEKFRRHRGILRTSEAKKLGIDYRTLARMVDSGLVVQEARGIYQLAELSPPGNPDLIQIALRVPNSIVCLISALHFHNLTTQIPHRVYIALPRTHKGVPRIEYPPLDIVWLSEAPYRAGIEEHELDGVLVRIYSREKTIADCFKFRNKIGMDVALEALQDYMSRRDRNIERLVEYARIDRVEQVIRPYLEALV
jgi:predicted transcriptional regulator of viral defense system